jgi:hypothetical protein
LKKQPSLQAEILVELGAKDGGGNQSFLEQLPDAEIRKGQSRFF